MTEIAQPIDLQLSEKLQDQAYRQRFFLAEASARIAEQLIKLRKRRGLSQKEVADLVDTKQPAISRAEQADYQNWSFSTLRGIASALDARIRVIIEPAEDILAEYDEPVVVVAPSDAPSGQPVKLERLEFAGGTASKAGSADSSVIS